MNISELNPGDRIMLDDDTPAIYIGPGGCRTPGNKSAHFKCGDFSFLGYEIVFHPIEDHVISYWSENEWFQQSLSEITEDYPTYGWSLGWSDDVLDSIMNRKKYIIQS